MNLIPWRNKERENGGTGTSELAAWRPYDEFRTEMDRLFNRFFSEDLWGDSGALARWPALDVSEDEKSVTVRAEVPGIEPKDLEVSVTGNVLTISGESKYEVEK